MEERVDLNDLISHVSKACEMLLTQELNEVRSKYSLKSIEGLNV